MADIYGGGFLSGYLDSQQRRNQADLGAIQQGTGLMGILAQAQQQQQRQQLQGMLSQVAQQTGGDPAKMVPALLSTGSPQGVELAAKLHSLLPKPTEGFTLAPGAQRFDPKGELIAEAPVREPKGQNVSNLQRLMLEREGLAANDPMRPVYDNAIKKESEGAGSMRVHVNNPAPVTPVTIQDPTDPNKTIIIDGRTRQKLGDGPKLSATGVVDQKLIQALPQAKLRVDSISQNLDRLDTAMSELYSDPGLTHITGSLAGRTPNVLNVATGAQAKLDSIKSQVFQSSLQAMREASKTGGAVGNVSDREGDKLERTLAALDQAQGTADFKVQLNKARAQLRQSKSIIRASFDEQFGGVQGAPTAAPANGGWKVTPVP